MRYLIFVVMWGILASMSYFYEGLTGEIVRASVKSKRRVEEIPQWSPLYIDKTSWYKGHLKNRDLKRFKLEPLTVKEIVLYKENAYDKKNRFLYTYNSWIIVKFQEINGGIRFSSKKDFIDSFFWENPYTAVHPEWPDEIWELIKKEVIRIGMSKEQVELSWGILKKKIYEYISYGYIKETYSLRGYYLSFVNNILKNIQVKGD